MSNITITLTTSVVALVITSVVHIMKVASTFATMQAKLNEVENKVDAIGKKKDQLEKETSSNFTNQALLIREISTKLDYIKNDIAMLQQRTEKLLQEKGD